MRVRRTRSSASAPHSPLTRCPLVGVYRRHASLRVVVLSLTVFNGALSGVPGLVPTEWKVYKSESLAISIRYPPSMTVHTGQDARYQGFIPWSPSPDVRLALSASSFRHTTIGEAVVAIYAGRDAGCAPPEAQSSATILLAGRRFYRYELGEGATGHSLQAECFSTIYRGKCFTIMAVIQRFRYDGDSPQWVARAEKRREAIETQLMRVLKTLAFTDPP